MFFATSDLVIIIVKMYFKNKSSKCTKIWKYCAVTVHMLYNFLKFTYIPMTAQPASERAP